VILIRYLHAWLSDSNPFSAFVSLAAKGFFAAIAFGALWAVWIFLHRGQSSQQQNSSSKGATP
jgi:hypothetical protein